MPVLQHWAALAQAVMKMKKMKRLLLKRIMKIFALNLNERAVTKGGLKL